MSPTAGVKNWTYLPFVFAISYTLVKPIRYVMHVQGVDGQLPSVITVNVGGTLFTTALSTLRRFPDSLLGSMFSGRHRILRDKDGHPFVDADPAHFRYILEYLRTEVIPPEDLALDMYKMASYFSIEPLRERLLFVPAVAKMLVKELYCNRFGRYSQTKQRVIKLAIERAARDPSSSGLVNVLVELRQGSFADASLSEHKCVRETADIRQDDDNHSSQDCCDGSVYDEQFVSCIQRDLTDSGFATNISFFVCVFGCPYAIAKISIQF